MHLVDVTVPDARQGDRAEASLASSTRFIELDAFVWSSNTVRVAARNISGAAFGLGAATLSVAVTKTADPVTVGQEGDCTAHHALASITSSVSVT